MKCGGEMQMTRHSKLFFAEKFDPFPRTGKLKLSTCWKDKKTAESLSAIKVTVSLDIFSVKNLKRQLL
jgi:hypothetical protein